MIETTLIDCELTISASALAPSRTMRGTRIALEHGAEYVLDGNRIRAYVDGTRWFETADRDVWLRVSSTGNVWVYRHIGNGRFAPTHEILDAWEMTSQLPTTVADCDRHGHAWSPAQLSHGRMYFVWLWCLVCGVEGVTSPAHRRELIWPADAGLIQLATGGRLPRLHGPLFGGQGGMRKSFETFSLDENRKEGVTRHQPLGARTLGGTCSHEQTNHG